MSVVVVLFAFGSFVTTLLGGLTALRVRDYRHLVLGLAAGLMLGVVALDLIPEALSQQPGSVFGVPSPLLAFVLGFLVLHIIERTVGIHRGHESEYADHSHAPAVGFLAASGLVGHSVMDGFAIGAAFQAGSSVGIVVAVAVIAHDFADGFNTYTIATLYGNNRRRAITLLAADAIAPVIGASITLLFLIPHGVLGLYLGFFAGFLMYLATSDILPEAHASHPTRLTVLSTIGGVAFIWLVVGLAS
jgi:ZIP family zinc transporter